MLLADLPVLGVAVDFVLDVLLSDLDATVLAVVLDEALVGEHGDELAFPSGAVQNGAVGALVGELQMPDEIAAVVDAGERGREQRSGGVALAGGAK